MTIPEPIRTDVFEERGEECFICGRTMEGRQQDLSLHHINGDDSDHRVGNLIPVCQSCHLRIHRTAEGEYQEWHEKLPDSSKGPSAEEMSNIMQQFSDKDNQQHQSDKVQVKVNIGTTAKEHLPIEFTEWKPTIRFESEKRLTEQIEEWNAETDAGVFYYREAHPATKQPDITHTIGFRRERR